MTDVRDCPRRPNQRRHVKRSATSSPSVNYMEWSATCDTLHAHTQVLGKLAVALAPPEPHLQHAAIDCTRPGRRSRSRRPTAPARSSAGLDLRLPEASLDHSDGRMQCVALMPNRPVDEVARGIVGAARSLGGPVEIDPTPQEVSWSVPLDEDDEHATYDGDGGFVLRLRDPRRARAGARIGVVRRRSTRGGVPSISQ